MASRSAANSFRSCCSSGCFTVRLCLLLFLAGDAHPGPWNGLQPGLGDRLAAVLADAIGPLVDAPERLFDRLQDLRVCLFELQLDVDFVVAAGLVRPVTLAAGVVFHGPLQRLGGGAAQQFAPLAEQRVPVVRLVHLATTPLGLDKTR